ncbi:MAG: hypothetical protein LBH94_06985 [Deltaproteobacteria bacterium]|nr:hypothetical protein [Deltaproteobacteria bacterium]
MPEAQAKGKTEAHADAMRDFAASRELATKSDLLELKHELLKWIIWYCSGSIGPHNCGSRPYAVKVTSHRYNRIMPHRRPRVAFFSCPA